MNSSGIINREIWSLGENVQQMDKNFVKTGLFDENDKNRVLDVTGGDNYTYLVSKMYAWMFQIGEYNRGDNYDEGKKVEQWEKYYRNELDKYHQEFKNYNDNVFPIENFSLIDGGSLHPIEIAEGLYGRREALDVLMEIPKVYLRNLRDDIRKPRDNSTLRYLLPDLTRKIRSHLKLIGRLSDEKQNIIYKKAFSSKNNTLEHVLKHLDNTNINYLTHEDGIDELRNKVEDEAMTEEAEMLFDNGNVIVVDVKSSDAVKSLGCGSQWCFSTEHGVDHWGNYADSSHVNIVYNFSEDADEPTRMVVVLPHGSVYNMYNEAMDGEENMSKMEGWYYLDSIGAADYINVNNMAQQEGKIRESTGPEGMAKMLNAKIIYDKDKKPFFVRELGGQKDYIGVFDYIKGKLRQIGGVSYHVVDNKVIPLGVSINDKYQRRGIGKALYQHIIKDLGMNLQPSHNQTKAGKKLWQGINEEDYFANMYSNDDLEHVNDPNDKSDGGYSGAAIPPDSEARGFNELGDQFDDIDENERGFNKCVVDGDTDCEINYKNEMNLPIGKIMSGSGKTNEDLEYQHIKGDATDDKFYIGESGGASLYTTVQGTVQPDDIAPWLKDDNEELDYYNINEEVIPYSEDNWHGDEELPLNDYANQAYELANREHIHISNNKDIKGFVLKDGVVAGAIFSSVDDSEYSFDVIVDRKYQGTGLGKELVRYGFDEYNEYKDAYGDDLKLNLDVVNPIMRGLLKKHHGLRDIQKTPTGHLMSEEESIVPYDQLDDVIKELNAECFAILSAFVTDKSNNYNSNATKILHDKILKPLNTKLIKMTGQWDANVLETAYFVLKPENMECAEFQKLIMKAAQTFNQESYLWSDNGDILINYTDGVVDDIGDDLNVTNSYVGFKFEGVDKDLLEMGLVNERQERHLNEESISRLLGHIQNNDFAIMSANRNEFSGKENQNKSKALSNDLQREKAGHTNLIGHWEELHRDSGDEVPVKEVSYFIPKPEGLDVGEFADFIIKLGGKYQQESVILGNNGIAYEVFENGAQRRLGKLTTQNIGKAYSSMRKKPNLDFTFEGFSDGHNKGNPINEAKRLFGDETYREVEETELKEKRDVSWMPNTTVPTVKKSCTLGGKSDGTSDACSQGDTGAVEYKPLGEDYESDSELERVITKLADNILDDYFFKTLESKIKRQLDRMSHTHAFDRSNKFFIRSLNIIPSNNAEYKDLGEVGKKIMQYLDAHYVESYDTTTAYLRPRHDKNKGRYDTRSNSIEVFFLPSLDEVPPKLPKSTYSISNYINALTTWYKDHIEDNYENIRSTFIHELTHAYDVINRDHVDIDHKPDYGKYIEDVMKKNQENKLDINQSAVDKINVKYAKLYANNTLETNATFFQILDDVVNLKDISHFKDFIKLLATHEDSEFLMLFKNYSSKKRRRMIGRLYKFYVGRFGEDNKTEESVTLSETNTYIDSMINEGNIPTLESLPFKEKIESMGGEIYSVGGAVRDEFLGKSSKDLDIMVTGIEEETLIKLLQKYGEAGKHGKKFGVIKFTPKGADPDDEPIDVALPRTEVSTGSGHKNFEVKLDHNLGVEDDLLRRDFTVNAIAKDVDGAIIDPFNGRQDLKDKVIRMTSKNSFIDDELRMLRAVQFAARFGFTIEPKTLRAIRKAAPTIKEVAKERWLEELQKIVDKGDPWDGLEWLKKTNLYEHMFGKDVGHNQAEFNKVNTLGEYIFLMIKDGQPEPARFFLTNLMGGGVSKEGKVTKAKMGKEIDALDMAHKNADNVAGRNRFTASEIIKKWPEIVNSELLPKEIDTAVQELKSARYPLNVNDLAVNGNDIMALGLSGKPVGDMKDFLLSAVYYDKTPNDRKALMDLVHMKMLKPKVEGLTEGVEQPKLNNYGCLMLFPEMPTWENILAKINDDDVYVGEGHVKGKENEPHVTILYGFHENVSGEDFVPFLSGISEPITLKIKGISHFENEEFDVVKLDCESYTLREIRQQLEQLSHTKTHPHFRPHMTLAYVKAGAGKKYDYDFKQPILIKGTKLVYSNPDKMKSEMNIAQPIPPEQELL